MEQIIDKVIVSQNEYVKSLKQINLKAIDSEEHINDKLLTYVRKLIRKLN